MNTSIAKLTKYLIDSNIPIIGIDGDKNKINILFKEQTTDQQKAQAQEIINNFDWNLNESIDNFNSQKLLARMWDIFQDQIVEVSPYFSVIKELLNNKDFKRLYLFCQLLVNKSIVTLKDLQALNDLFKEQNIDLTTL